MPVLETIFFYLFAIGAVIASIAVIVPRNPLYSAIALILDFFFFAGLYVLLSAHFMAVIQVLVYGGAIMVLFVFIIMLLNLRDQELGEPRHRFHHAVGIAVGVVFFAFTAMATSGLFDHQQIAQNRETAAQQAEAAAQQAEATGEKAAAVPIRTVSRVPSLYADLNEAGLEYDYQRQIAAMREGSDSPAARKYRTFDPEKRFEMPPVLAGEKPRGGKLTEPVSWGTVEPISVLLVNRFVVPFELTALLLLAAIVGAMIIAKKRL